MYCVLPLILFSSLSVLSIFLVFLGICTSFIVVIQSRQVAKHRTYILSVGGIGNRIEKVKKCENSLYHLSKSFMCEQSKTRNAFTSCHQQADVQLFLEK